MQLTQAINSERMTIVNKERYKVDIEYNEEYAIIHLPLVEHFSKELYYEMKEDFKSICSFLSTVGYEYIYAAVSPDDTKINRLATKFGLQSIGAALGLNVYRKEI